MLKDRVPKGESIPGGVFHLPAEPDKGRQSVALANWIASARPPMIQNITKPRSASSDCKRLGNFDESRRSFLFVRHACWPSRERMEQTVNFIS